VTVLGGLISSTLLNLVVLPALVERYGGPREKDLRDDVQTRPAEKTA
jgi:Cu/Ag efflux pump CusA